MRYLYNVLCAISCVLCLAGCADVKTPTAQYTLTHPLGTQSMVTAGTSKDEVLEKWGEPNEIIEMGYDERRLKREAWIYEPWFPHAPLDYRHFSRRKKIYFTGDYVTRYEDIEGVSDKKSLESETLTPENFKSPAE